MKKSLKYAFYALIVLLMVLSCEEKIVTPELGFKTPTITGTISLPDTAGVSPADVWVKVIDPNGQTKNVSRVSSDGSFAVSGLKENEKYEVFFSTEEPDHNNYNEKGLQSKATSSSGFGGWLGQVDAAINEGNNVGSVKMKPLGTIKGKAMYKNLNEHYDIEVYIPGTSYIAKTAEDGSWSIFNVPQGTHKLRITSAGYIAQMMENVNLVGPEDDYETNPVLVVKDTTLIKYEGTVTGKIQIAGLSDLSGISVSLDGENADGDESVITAKDGTYTIPDVNPGAYKLIAQKAGYIAKEIGGITVRSSETYNVETINLVKRTASVSGKVTMNGLSDHSGISLLLESADTKHAYSATTDNSGFYRFNDIEPSVYTLYVSKDGYVGKDVTGIKVISNQNQTLSSIKLSKSTGIVTGIVILKGQNDHSGVSILLEGGNADGDELAISSKDGTYTITDINPGSYTLLIFRDGFLGHRTDAFNVKEAEVVSIPRITLSVSTAIVNGNAKLAGSNSHEGIAILLKSDSVQYSTTTDESGNWSFDKVSPGTYSLLISKDGYSTKQLQSIVLSSSDDVVLDELTLPVAQRSVTGRITLEGRNDHSGVSLTATNINYPTIVYAALTNSDGNYSFAGMKPGEYTITASSSGYVTFALPTVNVRTEAVSNIDEVELQIARGLISGIARLEGRADFSGIEVELVGTEYRTVTASDGTYSFSVPSGNYAGGVRFSHGYYATVADGETITVLTNGSYSVHEIELDCLYADVEGSVDVLGTEDNSGVTVALAGNEFITESDGTFSFKKVPLGLYTLSLERENTPRVTSSVAVYATDVVSLDGYTMIPNSATLVGNVILDGMTDHSGISVIARGDDGSEYSVLTEESGYFYMGNVLTSGTYSVTFEKDGWDTPDAISVTGLQSLEERDITKSADVVMYDTTAPSFDSVIINTGVGTTSNRVVTLHINAEDKGSGIEHMQICTDNIFDRTVTMRAYMPQVEYEFESGNGERTVYIKLYDKSGNESVVKSSTVTLTDQKREVYGVLSGDDLHWTKEMSPYYVTGNLMVEDGDTLIIDPGVDVQLAGAYSLTVRGILDAVGTEEERISIYGVESGIDKWEGIKFESLMVHGGTLTSPVYVSGNRIKNADITGLATGLKGNAWVENSTIESINGYALGSSKSLDYYSGLIKDSSIEGIINLSNASLYSSSIESEKILNYGSDADYYQGNEINTSTIASFSGINNNVIGAEVVIKGHVLENSFENCAIDVGTNDVVSSSFDNCSFSNFAPTMFEFNNMIGCDSIETMLMSQVEWRETADARNNFWGYDKTRELDEGAANMSFINDYYDGDFDKLKVVYDGYSSEPFEAAGYKGDKYLPMPRLTQDLSDKSTILTIDDERNITVNGSATIDIEADDITRYTEYRIFSYSSDAFETGNWEKLEGDSISFEYDPDKHGSIYDYYIQFKDNEGNETGIENLYINMIAEGPNGYIIHDKGEYTDGWRFIEAAPNDLRVVNGVPTVDSEAEGYSSGVPTLIFGYYRTSDNGTNIYVNGTAQYDGITCASTHIGKGESNTEKLVKAMGESTYSKRSGSDKTADYAARLCSILDHNGYNDWFLPSRDELNLMYESLHESGLGTFFGNSYWSSSEYDINGDASYAWFQNFSSGDQNLYDRNYEFFYIRPCRAF